MKFKIFVTGFLLFLFVVFGTIQAAHADQNLEGIHEEYAKFLIPSDPQTALKNIHETWTKLSVLCTQVPGQAENCQSLNIIPQGTKPEDFRLFILYVTTVDPSLMFYTLAANQLSQQVDDAMTTMINNLGQGLTTELQVDVINNLLKELVKQTEGMNQRILKAAGFYGINIQTVVTNDPTLVASQDQFVHQVTNLVSDLLVENHKRKGEAPSVNVVELQKLFGMGFELQTLYASLNFHIGGATGDESYFSYLKWTWQESKNIQFGAFDPKSLRFFSFLIEDGQTTGYKGQRVRRYDYDWGSSTNGGSVWKGKGHNQRYDYNK